MKVIHLYEAAPTGNQDYDTRHALVERGWQQIHGYGTKIVPVPVAEFHRTGRILGGRDVPFLRDVLLRGLDSANNDDDIIMLTNHDTWLRPDILDNCILKHIETYPAFAGRRVHLDRQAVHNPMDLSMELWLQYGERDYYGRDLFVFRVGWLKNMFNYIADFMLGVPGWDWNILWLIRKWYGSQKLANDQTVTMDDGDLPFGWVAHWKHSPVWMSHNPILEPARAYNEYLTRLVITGAWAWNNTLYVQPKRILHEPAYILLGKYGDIVNALPALRYIAKMYARPHVIVAREFANIFDGVSYVNPIPIDVWYGNVGAALSRYAGLFEDIKILQYYRTDMKPAFGHWMEYPFKAAGAMHVYYARRNGEAWACPIFDRRDYSRERRLIDLFAEGGTPFLLVNARAGEKVRWQLLHIIYEAAERVGLRVVDISNTFADRIYDVLGLMEQASGIITGDTATAHLAAAPTVSANVLTFIHPETTAPIVAPTPRHRIVEMIDPNLSHVIRTFIESASNCERPEKWPIELRPEQAQIPLR